jgi:hypothetical protein
MKIEVIEKHLKINGKEINNGDFVKFKYGDDNKEFSGYFYMATYAHPLNNLLCDFLISDKKIEDWTFWKGGYDKGFLISKVKEWKK